MVAHAERTDVPERVLWPEGATRDRLQTRESWTSPDQPPLHSNAWRCDAGPTSLNVSAFGMASVCKVSRDHPIPLLKEGVAGLSRIGDIADRALGHQGGCTGCALSTSCTTCMPLAALHRKAGSPQDRYCQHT